MYSMQSDSLKRSNFLILEEFYRKPPYAPASTNLSYIALNFPYNASDGIAIAVVIDAPECLEEIQLSYFWKNFIGSPPPDPGLSDLQITSDTHKYEHKKSKSKIVFYRIVKIFFRPRYITLDPNLAKNRIRTPAYNASDVSNL